MKIAIIPFFLLLVVTELSSENLQYNLKLQNLNGKVAYCKTEKALISENMGEYIVGEFMIVDERRYDKKGNQIIYRIYGDYLGYTINAKWNCKYKDNRIVEENIVSVDGKVIEKYRYEYNNLGQVSISYTDLEPYVHSKTIFEYNSMGKIAEELILGLPLSDGIRVVYSYVDKNHLRIDNYSLDGKKSKDQEIEYDDHGNEVVIKLYSINLTKIFEYQYDKMGNWIQKSVFGVKNMYDRDYKILTAIWKRKIEYY